MDKYHRRQHQGINTLPSRGICPFRITFRRAEKQLICVVSGTLGTGAPPAHPTRGIPRPDFETLFLRFVAVLYPSQDVFQYYVRCKCIAKRVVLVEEARLIGHVALNNTKAGTGARVPQ